MAYKLFTLPKVTVTTAGTAVPLTANEGLAAGSIIISASNDNTGKIFVGDSSVDAETGEQLEPGMLPANTSPSLVRWDKERKVFVPLLEKEKSALQALDKKQVNKAAPESPVSAPKQLNFKAFMVGLILGTALGVLSWLPLH
jgi:hypothetical protein